jgi:hypothetical protein
MATGVATAAETPSKQKGVAASAYLSTDLEKVQALRVGWAYNWSWKVPASTSTLDSVPMVWGAGSVTSASLKALTDGRKSGAYHELLGFNEPDMSSQANMTPQQAINLWPSLQSTGLSLGSPAVANPNDGWLDRFMALAAAGHYRVDFITLHFYPDFTSTPSVSGVLAVINRIWAKYHLPIWVTEVGAIDIQSWSPMATSPNVPAAISFMQRMTAQFGTMPDVVRRYAWFVDNSRSVAGWQTTSLYDSTGTRTDLGKAFVAVRGA